MTDCRKKEWEMHQAETWREPRFLLHFRDLFFIIRRDPEKPEHQDVCIRHHEQGLHRQNKGIQSPSRGNPYELMKCKASQCHTKESKKVCARGLRTCSAELQAQLSWAGPTLISPRRQGSPGSGAAPAVVGLALCRGQQAACGGTGASIHPLALLHVPRHTPQPGARHTCRRQSAQISFGQHSPAARH